MKLGIPLECFMTLTTQQGSLDQILRMKPKNVLDTWITSPRRMDGQNAVSQI